MFQSLESCHTRKLLHVNQVCDLVYIKSQSLVVTLEEFKNRFDGRISHHLNTLC